MIREKDPLIDTLEKMFNIFDNQANDSFGYDENGVAREEDLYAEGCADMLHLLIGKLNRDTEKIGCNWSTDNEIEKKIPGAYDYNPTNDRYPMSRKFTVAHLIGKTRDEEERFRKVEIELTKMGYICFTPAIYDSDVFKQYQETIDEMCYEKLLVCDLCVLVTPEHIGVSTTKRILQAEKLGIPIYTFNGTRLIPFDILEVKDDE